MVPVGEGGFGWVEGKVACLVVIGPVRLGKAGLDFTALSTRRDRTCRSAETHLQIEVCTCACRADLDERPGDVTAVHYGIVAEKVLSHCALPRIQVTNLELTQRHTASAAIQDVEVRLDLVVRGGSSVPLSELKIRY